MSLFLKSKFVYFYLAYSIKTDCHTQNCLNLKELCVNYIFELYWYFYHTINYVKYGYNINSKDY